MSGMDRSDKMLTSSASEDTASASGSKAASSGAIGNNLIYKILELACTQGILFAVSVVLARILSPEEYGTISLITIFITIANVFVQSGFSMALIQKKDADDSDYSSVFCISMILAALLYLVLWLTSGWIARYYETPILKPLLKVTGIILFPGALVSIQSAYISRNMQFRKLLIASVIAVIISGTGAIILALRGAGAWAMSLQQIIYYFVLAGVLLVMITWKPRLRCDLIRVKVLFSFGWKILVSGLLDTLWNSVYGLVIGKQFSAADLGGYNRGDQFPKLIASNLGSAVQAVMLPAYSNVQDEKERLRAMLADTIRYSVFFLFPMMAGLIVVARPLVIVLLTDKWLFCVPYLQLLCLYYALYPVHTANLAALNAQGRSDLFLRLELMKKVSGIFFLLIGLKHGIIVLLIYKVVNECVCAYLNIYYNKGLLGYGALSQIKDMLPATLCSLGMAATAALPAGLPAFAGIAPILLMAVQILLGVISYAILSLLFNKKTVSAVLAVVRPIKHSTEDEFKEQLDEAQNWAASAGYTEDDVDIIIKEMHNKKETSSPFES